MSDRERKAAILKELSVARMAVVFAACSWNSSFPTEKLRPDSAILRKAVLRYQDLVREHEAIA